MFYSCWAYENNLLINEIIICVRNWLRFSIIMSPTIRLFGFGYRGFVLCAYLRKNYKRKGPNRTKKQVIDNEDSQSIAESMLFGNK